MNAILADDNRCGRRLMRSLPAVIEDTAENDRALAEIERFHAREHHLPPEERRLMQLLLLLVEDYEGRKYRLKAAAPHEVLRELMRARGTQQADLLGVLGSKGVTSEVVRGRRGISRSQAKRLAEFFHAPAILFL